MNLVVHAIAATLGIHSNLKSGKMTTKKLINKLSANQKQKIEKSAFIHKKIHHCLTQTRKIGLYNPLRFRMSLERDKRQFLGAICLH